MRHRFIWFCRNDLRLHDNPCLQQVLAHKGEAEVLPVYVFDPRHFRTTRHGSCKTGIYRARFLHESVAALRSELRTIGSDLLVGVGKPEELLPKLVAAHGAGASPPPVRTTILCQAQVTSEELKVDAALRSALPAGVAQFTPVWGGTLYEKSELPFRADLADLPDVFTPFRNQVESRCTVRQPLRAPGSGRLPLPATDSLTLPNGLGFGQLPHLEELGLPSGLEESSDPSDPRGVMPFLGGEAAALARLKHYLWDSDALGTYFDTRNGMLGADYSSKFAPWLAHGCLSPRTVAYECKKYERERVKNKSTYWMVFELIWRDFFRLYCAKHGRAVFMEGGPVNSHHAWRRDAELERRWKEGKTGMPLVDANMRELACTGFMSNRGRQNVASYFALDLQLDWRCGADHFESLLLDYDVCSNWGNWAAAAGLTGGRVNRFNIVKQSKDYDADGAYVRHWLPELRQLPAHLVHEPWKMSRTDQERFGVRIGTYGAPDTDYPNPPQSRFQYSGDGSAGGRGYAGGGRGRGSGSGGGGVRNVRPTPTQTAAMSRESSKGQKGSRRAGSGRAGSGGSRKRVQYGAFAEEDE